MLIWPSKDASVPLIPKWAQHGDDAVGDDEKKHDITYVVVCLLACLWRGGVGAAPRTNMPKSPEYPLKDDGVFRQMFLPPRA